jgi:hypothetical protein
MGNLGFALRQPGGDCLDAAQVTEMVVQDLVREPVSGAKSWNVAVPPCFGEAHFVQELLSGLRTHSSTPLVALIEPDAVSDVDGLVRNLHGVWRREVLPEIPIEGMNCHEILTNVIFGNLPRNRRAVIVFSRFHKLLQFADTWILGALRTAERDRNLRILTTTPMTLDAMQRLDSNLRSKLTISNFGDTHSKRVVSVPGWELCSAAFAESGLSEEDGRWIYDASGGYPECVNAVVEAVRNGLKVETNSAVGMRQVHTIIDDKLAKVVDSLRKESSRTYFDALVDLYHGVDREKSQLVLRTHDWREILLDEHGELRSERLGVVAGQEAFRLAIESGEIVRTVEGVVGVAEQMYRGRQYANADAFLRQHRALIEAEPRIAVLASHAQLMAILYRGEGLGEDTDWCELRARAARATERLNGLPKNAMKPIAGELLRQRYAELSDVAEKMTNAIDSLGDGEDARIVEFLTDQRNPAGRNEFLAALLLVLRYEAGFRCHGATAACQTVLPLPEQAYCLWACWAAGVRRDEGADPSASEWTDVEEAWKNAGGSDFRRIDGRGRFTSFRAFAMYALARYLRCPSSRGNPPEAALAELNGCLRFFEAVRNGRAHTLSITRKQTRDDFFTLIERWLDAALSVCPASVTRAQLADLVSPLPILNEHGALVELD